MAQKLTLYGVLIGASFIILSLIVAFLLTEVLESAFISIFTAFGWTLLASSPILIKVAIIVVIVLFLIVVAGLSIPLILQRIGLSKK